MAATTKASSRNVVIDNVTGHRYFLYLACRGIGYNIAQYRKFWCVMTSSNGNNFRITGLCAENSPVTGGFPSQRPVTQTFAVFFDLHLNKRLSKQSRRRWFETPSRLLWCQCNGPWNMIVSTGKCVFRSEGSNFSLTRRVTSTRSTWWDIETQGNVVVLGGTGHNDNHWCYQLRQSWHHGNFWLLKCCIYVFWPIGQWHIWLYFMT